MVINIKAGTDISGQLCTIGLLPLQPIYLTGGRTVLEGRGSKLLFLLCLPIHHFTLTRLRRRESVWVNWCILVGIGKT